jgi:hypothetical protein
LERNICGAMIFAALSENRHPFYIYEWLWHRNATESALCKPNGT